MHVIWHREDCATTQGMLQTSTLRPPANASLEEAGNPIPSIVTVTPPPFPDDCGEKSATTSLYLITYVPKDVYKENTTTLHNLAARGGATHAVVDVVAVVMEHKLFVPEGRLSALRFVTMYTWTLELLLSNFDPAICKVIPPIELEFGETDDTSDQWGQV